MAAKDRKKSSRKRGVTRRRALGTLAAGAGVLLASRATRATELLEGSTANLEELGAQWLSWEDGWAYPIVGTSEIEGWWIVEFDDGEYAVEPHGWVLDTGVWYMISEFDSDGVWYFGDDGYVYLLTTDLMFDLGGSLSV